MIPLIVFSEGERILILPWAQAGCQIDLRDFRPGRPSCCLDFMRDREWHGNKIVLRVSFDVEDTSIPTSNSVFFQHVELRTTDNQISQPIAIAPSCTKYNCVCKPVRLWQTVADFFKSKHRVFCKKLLVCGNMSTCTCNIFRILWLWP